jgi:hypothetical protein
MSDGVRVPLFRCVISLPSFPVVVPFAVSLHVRDERRKPEHEESHGQLHAERQHPEDDRTEHDRCADKDENHGAVAFCGANVPHASTVSLSASIRFQLQR